MRLGSALHIIFVAPFGLKHKTTVWARTLPIAQQLVAAGHHATILIPPWDSPEDSGKSEIVGGVRMEQLSLAGGLLGTVRRLLQAIDAAHPDVVHIVKPRAHAGMVQWWLWHRRKFQASPKFKVVLDVDDWEQAWNAINRYPWAVGHFLAWQEAWGIRHADGIICASHWLTAKIAEVAPHIRTLYLPNGVAPLPYTPNNLDVAASSAPKILFFTRLVEVTPEWLRAFWEATLRQLPTAKLVIAGTPVQPWLAAPFESALANMPQVRWTGYVPTAQLPQLYAEATCAIFPAQPIPLLQAKCSVRLATTLLHGVPIIASDVGEQSSYGAEGAARLVPGDATPAEFAHAVVETIQDSAAQVSMRTTASARLLTRYAWSRLTATLPSFYESL